jgi:mRNA-degrading endonuclease RelE of RelBE toxin-antitoxin system
MPYKIGRTSEFKKQYKKLTKKNQTIQDRLDDKFKKIINNPEIGEPKSYNLKYTRGTHVDPFVIVYMFFSDTILFLVIVKDLPLYKGVWSYGYHGVAPVSEFVS